MSAGHAFRLKREAGEPKYGCDALNRVVNTSEATGAVNITEPPAHQAVRIQWTSPRFTRAGPGAVFGSHVRALGVRNDVWSALYASVGGVLRVLD